VGTLFVLIGFGLATTITLQMGWRNAFGEKKGLRTSGAFAISRNPVYVVTWLGLLGWGLIVADLLVTILLTAWFLMYVLAPLLEEPWLEEQYGDEYVGYKSGVPRFL
jgi:protein-S-isoprenylcysteine O-methyltransferase Ste14